MSDRQYCRRCGSKLKVDSRFCIECGGSIADDDAAPPAPAAGEDNALRWRVEVPLLSNRFIISDTLLGGLVTVLIAGSLIGGIFAYSGGWEGLRAGFIFAGIFAGFYLFVAFFTFAVIFGNRWPLEFVVGEHGVVMNNVSEKARFIHRFSWILALVTGRPLMAGPGLIAQSREVVGIPWNEVRTVRKYPALGVIYLRGGLLENVRLYCLPSNYTQAVQRVEAAVRQQAPSATIS
jgi:hypothetical protein